MHEPLADTRSDDVRLQRAQALYERFHGQCFWDCAPDLKLTARDIVFVVERLLKEGDRQAYLAGMQLCR